MVTSRFRRGFSLIELMVTVTIMAILVLVGLPLTSGWVNSSKVAQSKSQLTQGMAILKATALKNAGGTVGGSIAAVMISTGSSLCIYSSAALPTAVDCSTAGALWKADLSASLTLNGIASQCIALDSAALPVASTIGSTACTTTLSYSLTKGAGSGAVSSSGMLN